MYKNIGLAPFEFIDPAFQQGPGVGVPESAKVTVAVGDNIPDEVWNALPEERRGQLIRDKSVESVPSSQGTQSGAVGKPAPGQDRPV